MGVSQTLFRAFVVAGFGIVLWTYHWSKLLNAAAAGPPGRDLTAMSQELHSHLRVERALAEKLHKENAELRAALSSLEKPTASSLSSSDVSKKLTVVLMSYPKSDRFHRLEEIIKNLKNYESDMVHEILLVWNGERGLVPKAIVALEGGSVGAKLRVLPQTANKLDNRWRIWREVTTEAILNLDDDVDIKERGVRCLFDTWRSAPERLIAVDVRSHSDDPKALKRAATRSGIKDMDTWAYSPRHTDASGRNLYSIALPRILMGNKMFWKGYDEAAEKLQGVVGDLLCDDIAFNFVAANMTQAGPVYVRAPFAPYSESNSATSLQKSKNMKAKRQRCLPALAKVFGGMVLRYNSWVGVCAWDGESGNHK